MTATLQIKPQRIWLIRHGESVANVDPAKYKEIPDHLIPLTEKGWFQQALPCGQFMAKTIEEGGDLSARKFVLWHSSFLRACQTAKGIHKAIEKFNPHVWMRDSLGEVSFGYADGLSESEAKAQFPEYAVHQARDAAFGTKQFLRPPNGRSRADAGADARLFISSLHRKTAEYGITDHVIVSHGAMMRVVAKEWLNLPWDVADQEKNPNNCDVRFIARSPDDTHYIDYGYIYVKGQSKEPQARRYENAAARMASNQYIPAFARN